VNAVPAPASGCRNTSARRPVHAANAGVPFFERADGLGHGALDDSALATTRTSRMVSLSIPCTWKDFRSVFADAGFVVFDVVMPVSLQFESKRDNRRAFNDPLSRMLVTRSRSKG
jgi:hypothetical protein